jgi:hypothetical protein
MKGATGVKETSRDSVSQIPPIMETTTLPQDLRAHVECCLLMDWYSHYRGEFLIECERVGLKFIRDAVDPDDHERFSQAFDELVALGCRPVLLASSLYFFHTSRIYDFPAISMTDAKLVPRFVGFQMLPTTRAVKGRLWALEQSAEVIEWLNDSGIIKLLSTYVKSPPHHERVLDALQWYVRVLRSWSKPRSDVIRGFGPIACCAYAQLGTRHFQFPLISQLIECLGCKPDPKHQHALRKSAANVRRHRLAESDISDELAGDPADQSLERNFRLFKAAHPKVCRELRLSLVLDHVAEHTERPEAVNWKEVFAPYGKYDHRTWRSAPM